MRKSQKQEVLKSLKSLEGAHDKLKKMSEPVADDGVSLLAECQQFAQQIGEIIESMVDSNQCEKTIKLFEEYCDLLYKVGKGEARVKKLPQHLVKIEESIKHDLPTKLEVAFLPYKASMWDSLESIYLAAKDDPNCDAYVVPIPYFEKQQGGALGQMRFDGDKYLKNIPVIDYQTYNIAERRPDIIFVHNPYDNTNFVTTVHPDYYCAKLREQTDCLVYVPYFVGNGKEVGEHFCTVPGCIYSHKVIVQTPEERKCYIKTFKEFAKKHKLPITADQIENKFLALGSPKLDKVINTKREDYELPDDWKKLIGDNKKVIFYNTSIGALLQHTIDGNKPSNKYLQKMRSVFEFFKNRDDVVLLWRPHPLLESTIKSMRPWIAQEYAEIVNEFKGCGYGIYDDSEDLNRAIAVSDGYYGDGSSVTQLFDSAGKFVSWQLFEPHQTQVRGLYVDKDYVWFMDVYNVLYRHNKETEKTEYMGIAPQKNYSANLLIAENNKKLYFAPYYETDKISIFNIEKNEFEQIKFKDEPETTTKFRSVVPFKNFVYFIPYSFNSIMRLNTNTNEIEYFSVWLNDVLKLQTSKLPNEAWNNLKFWWVNVVGSELALTIYGTNAIMFFDMETGNYEIKNIGGEIEHYTGISFDGQNYYLCPRYKNYVMKWNRRTEEITKIKLPSFSRKEYMLLPNFLSLFANEYIWLFPVTANNAYKINVNTNEVTELPELMKHFESEILDWHYGVDIVLNDNFLYSITQTQGVAKYNIDTDELKFIRCDFDEAFTLLYQLSNFKSDTITKTENSGKKIWETLK